MTLFSFIIHRVNVLSDAGIQKTDQENLAAHHHAYPDGKKR